MTNDTNTITEDAQATSLSSPFIKELVKQWRAQDSHGAWDKKSNHDLIAPYIITKEMRRSLPIISDVDARTLQRIELFYNAVSMSIEQRTGVTAVPIIKMHHEGFGRLVLIAGRLVIHSRTMRDAHRFGFESMEKLLAEGEQLVEAGVEMIRAFPDIVNYNA
jgi:probable nitrogen fixation protein